MCLLSMKTSLVEEKQGRRRPLLPEIRAGMAPEG